jgi:hypothetical protein
MTDRMKQSQRRPDVFLRWAAVIFALGFAVHGYDHMRRGMMASPTFVMVGGTVQGILVVIAVVMAVMRSNRAPEAAIVVGFGSAVVFTYAHLLPTFWSGYQDSFLSAPHTNVTWFSWLSAVAEIGTGVVFGVAGVRARLARGALTSTA